MVEFRSEVKAGGLDSDYGGGRVVDCISNGAIALWAPVILVAAGTGEDFPRVGTTTTRADVDVYGVAVDGEDNDNTNAVSAAGKKIKVLRLGRGKLKVNAATVNIAIGDGLVTGTVAGVAVKVDYSAADNLVATVNAAIKELAAVFAVALKAATADGDFIPVDVVAGKGDTA